ncbi:MAG: hypothetical protein FWF18_03415 [Dehalococcoidia bacterium]|nr:hypothetical protein [Dehalococcoidia bacterium]
MKKLKLIALLSLIALTSIVMVACNNTDNNNGSPNPTTETCKNNDEWQIPDPGGEFTYDIVIVMLTDEASARDKTWAPSDFPKFAFSQIENKELTGSKRYLIFHLTEPSRENVLRAIYYLNTRPEIFSAEPNGIGYPG